MTTQTNEIMQRIFKLIGVVKCELNYNTAFELLIAVVLSAQCTDKRVNIVTRELFKVASTPQELMVLPIKQLEDILHSLGFFRAKARNIKQLATQLVLEFNGQVPSTREQLVTLAGVGQKTANVVLLEIYGLPYIAVDTHIFRVAHRLGLSYAKTPNGVEEDLYKRIDKSMHALTHHTLIHFGRYYCKAKNPLCQDCAVRELCKYSQKSLKG